ncbi:MAG: Trigger factor [Chloroflexi bacterium ADurb.Bin325]|nr:MAG: Trigger factor [Chloroflexi bacterium ADurb.Bin325]
MAEPLIITKSLRDDNQLDLSIELGPERTRQALERAARLVSKKARIPGFRPGKAPIQTVLRMFGKESVLGEIVDDLGEEVFTEALEAEQIHPYAQAALQDVTFDPVTFKLVVPLPPTVELNDYRSLRVDAPVVEATEAEVDAALEQARNAQVKFDVVERPAEIGDSVLVDIKGTVGEDTILENEDWELQLREGGGWLPGFDEAFVGLSAGDAKTFEITYPEDSQSRYKGQVASFDVKVKAVKSRALPEVTDEFVKTLGEYESVADYRAKKLAELQKARDAEARNTLTNSAVEALVANATISYPPAAVDEVVHNLIHSMEHRLADIGYTLQDSLRLQGKTLDAYRAELRPVAETRLKGDLALAELSRRENIVVSDEEVAAELERAIDASGVENEEQSTEIRDMFSSEAGRAVLSNDILTRKTLELLRAIVTGQELPAAPAEPASAEPAAEAVAADEPPAAESAEPAAEAAGEAPAEAAAANEPPAAESAEGEQE